MTTIGISSWKEAMFGPKRVIGIERHPSGMRFVELDQDSAPPRVLDFGMLNLPQEPVREAMHSSGRWRKRLMANAAITGPATEYDIIPLPLMSKKELRAVVGREIKKTTGWVYAYQVIDITETGETKKLQVMIGSALETELKGLWRDVEKVGLVPRLLTTPPIALKEALSLAEGFKRVALIHFGVQGWNLVITRGDGFFFRANPQEPDLQPDLVVREIERTLIHYKQSTRGQSIERIFLSGEPQLVAMMGEQLEGRLPVQAELFRPSESLDITPLGERTAEFREALPSLALVLGLALIRPSRDTLSLLPSEVKVQQRESRKQLVKRSTVAALVSLLALGHLVFAYRISTTQRLLKDRQETVQRLQPLVREVSEVNKARELYQTVSPFLDDASRRGPTWLPLFQELSLAVPNEVVLQSLKITATKDGWQLVLQGVASGSDSSIAMAAFNRFYARLNESPTFIRLSSELKLRHVTGGSTSLTTVLPQTASTPAPPRFEATFEVKGELRGRLNNKKIALTSEGGGVGVL